MDLDFCGKLLHASADFYHFQTDGIKLGVCILCALKIKLSKGMHKHIGHRVEKEPELIHLKTCA